MSVSVSGLSSAWISSKTRYDALIDWIEKNPQFNQEEKDLAKIYVQNQFPHKKANKYGYTYEEIQKTINVSSKTLAKTFKQYAADEKTLLISVFTPNWKEAAKQLSAKTQPLSTPAKPAKPTVPKMKLEELYAKSLDELKALKVKYNTPEYDDPLGILNFIDKAIAAKEIHAPVEESKIPESTADLEAMIKELQKTEKKEEKKEEKVESESIKKAKQLYESGIISKEQLEGVIKADKPKQSIAELEAELNALKKVEKAEIKTDISKPKVIEKEVSEEEIFEEEYPEQEEPTLEETEAELGVKEVIPVKIPEEKIVVPPQKPTPMTETPIPKPELPLSKDYKPEPKKVNIKPEDKLSGVKEKELIEAKAWAVSRLYSEARKNKSNYEKYILVMKALGLGGD